MVSIPSGQVREDWLGFPSGEGISIVIDISSDRLKVFGDESFDEKKQRVAAVAGLIGTEGEWSALQSAWVGRTGGKEFHAVECETEYANDPDTDKHRENLKLYADLCQIVAKSAIRGYGSAFDLISYAKNFPGEDSENGFIHGFSDVIKNLTRMADNENIQIEFTFDNRAGGEYNVGLVYQAFMQLPGWKGKDIFYSNKISFDNRNNPRVQAADLVARETMKFLDNYIGPVRRPQRKSLNVLANGGIEFVAYEGPYFKEFREAFPELAKRFGLEGGQYLGWLEKNGLVDNISNRMHYMMWLDKKGIQAKEVIKSTDDDKNKKDETAQ